MALGRLLGLTFLGPFLLRISLKQNSKRGQTMATIEDLRTSISSMENAEAFNLIREIRFLRRQPPPQKAKRATGSKKRSIKKKDPVSIVSQMTSEQAAELLKQLGG
jgi:hypothetical protein